MDGPRLAGIAAVALATVAIVGNLIAVPMILNKTSMITRKVQGGMAEFKTMSDRAWSEMMTIRTLQDSSIVVDRSRRQGDYQTNNGLNLNAGHNQPNSGTRSSSAKTGLNLNAGHNQPNSGTRPSPAQTERTTHEGGDRGTTGGGGSVSQAGSCPPGPPGPAGLNGEDGDAGEPGQDGEPGMSTEEMAKKQDECLICPAGPSGPVGAPGLPGPLGEKGESGEPGVPATDGFEGDIGEPGFPGNPGTPGKAGKKGPDGRAAPGGQGEPGPKGAPGPIGRAGEQGPRGNKNFLYGPPGTPGKEGTQGMDGLAGSTGPRGKKGPPGQPGSDAQYCPCPREFEYVDKNGQQRKYTQDTNGPAQPSYTKNGNKPILPVQNGNGGNNIQTQPINSDNNSPVKQSNGANNGPVQQLHELNEHARTPSQPQPAAAHENGPATNRVTNNELNESNYGPRRVFGQKTATVVNGDAAVEKENRQPQADLNTERPAPSQSNQQVSSDPSVNPESQAFTKANTVRQGQQYATESEGIHAAQEGVRQQSPKETQAIPLEQEAAVQQEGQGLHEAVGGVRQRRPQEEEGVTQETTVIDTSTGTVVNEDEEREAVYSEQVEEGEGEEETTTHTRKFVYLTKRPPFIYSSPPPWPTVAADRLTGNSNQPPQQLWPQVQVREEQPLNLVPQFQPSQQQQTGGRQQPIPLPLQAAPILTASKHWPPLTQPNNGVQQLLNGPTPSLQQQQSWQYHQPAPISLPVVQGVLNGAIPQRPLQVLVARNPDQIIGAPSYSVPAPASPPDVRPPDQPVQPGAQFDVNYAKTNQKRIGIWS